jgi:peptide/nickel transport system substrate-binding protein
MQKDAHLQGNKKLLFFPAYGRLALATPFILLEMHRFMVVAALCAFVNLQGCGGPHRSAQTDQLSIGVPYELNSMNPLLLSGADRLILGPLIYSQLFRPSPTGETLPWVAAVVPTTRNGGISKDGMTITYHLRHDVKWADGAPLTARDVIFTHQADLNPRNNSVETIGDREISSIVAPDPYTVRVRLRRPFSPFIDFDYFDRPLLPAHLLAKYKSLNDVDFNQHPVGSGPYRLAEWVRGDHMTFVRSENYWGPPARIPKIILKVIPNSDTMVAELLSGDVDATINIDPLQARRFLNNPTLDVIKTPVPLFELLIFNASDPRLADVRVRRALTLALNRRQIVRNATKGIEDAEHANKGLFRWAYDPRIEPLPYDPAAARRLLDEAGWKVGPDGIRARDGKRLDFTAVIIAGHPIFATEAAEAAQQLRAVGIELTTRAYVAQEYVLLTPAGVLWGGNFQIALTTFVGANDPDPDWLIGCDAAGKPIPYNFTHMCVPEIQRAMHAAVSTFDRGERKRYYAVVQRILNEQLPVVILSQDYEISVVPKRLHGYRPSIAGGSLWDVASWWLSPAVPQATTHGNGLTFGVTYEYKTLNPLYMSGADRLAIGDLVYNKLLGATKNGDLTPEVAAVVPTQANRGISADGKTITYHLRHDVKWADGQPLTARDVIFTHQADINPKNSVIETYGDNYVASIEALDPYTVRVRLKSKFVPFVDYFDRPLLPAHLLDKYQSLDKVDYNVHPVGSGPYKVAEWIRGDRITFVRSASYWGSPAQLPKITLRTIPDENTLALQLRSHDVDAAPVVDPNRAQILRSDPSMRFTKTFIPLFGLIIFNASDRRLADVRVRRALALALDRRDIVRRATHGFEDGDHPMRALFGWAFDPSMEPLPFDPDAARRLLDAAGWRPGPDGIRVRGSERLEFVLATQAAHPFLTSEALQMAQQARAVGIQLDIKTYSDQLFLLLTPQGVLWGGKFDIALTEFVGSGDPDPDWLIGCDAAGKPNPYNFSHMCIPGVAPVLKDAASTFDRARRKHDYKVVAGSLNEWLPILLLSQSALLGASPQRLHNFDPSPFAGDFWNVSSWWLSAD